MFACEFAVRTQIGDDPPFGDVLVGCVLEPAVGDAAEFPPDERVGVVMVPENMTMVINFFSIVGAEGHVQ